MKSLILFVFLFSIARAAAEPHSCCAAEEAKPYSAESIFQLEAAFTADSGAAFKLDQLRGQPAVVAMFFSNCTYACPLLLGDLMRLRARLPEAVRRQTRFVLVSFDTERDVPSALKVFREGRGLDDAWSLLHGNAGSVRELAALLGVKYRRMADASYSHSNLITVLNAEGEIKGQLSGLQGDITALADLVIRLAPSGSGARESGAALQTTSGQVP